MIVHDISQPYMLVEGVSGPLSVSSFRCSFQLGQIPACSVNIAVGTQFKSTKASPSMEAVWNADLQRTYGTLMVDIDHVPTELFHGLVLQPCITSSTRASGESVLEVGFTIRHPVGDLSEIAMSNFVYATGRTVNDPNFDFSSRQYDNQNARTKGNTHAMSWFDAVSSKIRMESYTRKSSYDIVDALCTFIDAAADGVFTTEYNGPRAKQYIKAARNYITGHLMLHNDLPYTEYFSKLCTSLESTMLTTDALAAVTGAVDSSSYLIKMVPSGTRTVSFIADSGWVHQSSYTEVPGNVVSNAAISRDITTTLLGPDTVAVSEPSSQYFNDNGTLGVTQAVYPPASSSTAMCTVMAVPLPEWLRVSTIQAPKTAEVLNQAVIQQGAVNTETWAVLQKDKGPDEMVVAMDKLESSVKTRQEDSKKAAVVQNTSGTAQKDYALMYAKAMYVKLLKSNSTLTLGVSPHTAKDWLPYLGQVLKLVIQGTYLPDELGTNIYGRLSAVSCGFSTGETSSMRVQLSFTHVRSETSQRLVLPEHPLYR